MGPKRAPPAMRPRDYLLDRLPLILGFAVALLFLLLVVHLAVARLRAVDAGYLLLLGAVSGAVCLLVDHQRQRPFRKAVARALGADREADEKNGFALLQLPPAKSREQRALAELLTHSQRSALEALQRHRRSAEEHRAFVDLWVHHMKTPLAVLEVTVQQQDGQGQDADSEWRSVREEVDELGRGLELMLAASRLERFELDLRLVTVDLVGVVRASVNELRRAWIRSGVFPSVDAPSGPVEVETDPKWLQVVLRQLLTNAMKYSEAGQKVTVGIRPLGGGGATVSVSDDGIGIPPEDVPRVFDRFFTGANGRRTKASTGMGLFLAAEVCRRLGHELSVESRVGQGSTFTVELRPEGIHRLL